jgi:lysophospholipase L1-like esterase
VKRATNFAAAAVAAAVLAGAGCDSTGPSPVGPIIVCPVVPAQQSPDGNAVPVHYSLPGVSGGAQPVSIACTPPSGSSFNVGSTTVTCTASDAKQQAASCTFGVTVTAPPKLTATKFVAFGDSITAGTLDPACHSSSAFALGSHVSERQILAASINVPTSYPTKLEAMLDAKYPTQSASVLNEGSAGEGVTGSPPNGPSRLPGVLAADAPQVVLIEEGINDISTSDPTGSTAAVVSGLRTMIQQARAANARVFLANFLPERAGACRGFRAGVIATANDQIRSLASGENVPLVDLYVAFGGDASPALIGFDGLHPTEAGYDLIAQTFFESIRKNLEVNRTTLRFR